MPAIRYIGCPDDFERGGKRLYPHLGGQSLLESYGFFGRQ
jgi:hypothetical protein